MTVAESIVINAPPERVFDVVSDFNTWTTWSPWLCAEPDAKVEVTENSNSVGSGYTWAGEVVGAGEMEHLSVEPSKRIEEKLTLLKPWKSTSKVTFDFEPAEGGTKVTWSMFGNWPWFMFWMRPMMENVIGMDYARGLKMLKEWIETGAILSKTNVAGVKPVGPIHMAGVRKTCGMDEINATMSSAITEAREKVRTAGVPTEDMTMSVYHHFDTATKVFDFTAGVMLLDPEAKVDGLTTWSMPKSNALAVEHIGCYAHLGNAWGAAYQHLRYRKLKPNNKVATFEIYRNEPGDTQPADLITDIFLPLK